MTYLSFTNIVRAIGAFAHAAVESDPPERSPVREFLDQPFVTPALKIVGGLVLVIIGIRIGRWLANLERNVLLRAHVDRILAEFLRNVSFAILLALIIVSALELSGFPTTSLLA